MENDISLIRNNIENVLESYTPISLDEMEHVQLMNRVDTKYILPVNSLPEILDEMKADYRILEIN